MDFLSGFALTTFQIESDSEDEDTLAAPESSDEEEEEEEQTSKDLYFFLQKRAQEKRCLFSKDKTKEDLRNTKTFRKLEQEIKDMNRRRKSRQNDSKDVQAIYVDKDRAISVNGGKLQ
ncbi:Hypothetical protein FKW44_009919 [Caligus rogercresseyi]|uniref:Uncharacterized protein n=1 Tax=Caligus rogercresseyi TaxID=217165 RepID=A0A7T8K7T6_CALRO|nr:Hypothetical protein FKW44_009919 [Caligus rogercresseyi]